MSSRIVPFTALAMFVVLACSPSNGETEAPEAPTPEVAIPAPPLAAAPDPAPASAEPSEDPQILFTNVSVFDGVNDSLKNGMNVLVEGNLIKQVSGSPISTAAGATVIDGGGRTLMPGLHDMHTHVGIYRPVAGDTRIDMSPFLVGAVAGARAEGMLMNGFTLIRDIGGPAKFLQRAIDAGIVVGPRVLPTEGFVLISPWHRLHSEHGRRIGRVAELA
jgi:hypothetical protein